MMAIFCHIFYYSFGKFKSHVLGLQESLLRHLEIPFSHVASTFYDVTNIQNTFGTISMHLLKW